MLSGVRKTHAGLNARHVIEITALDEQSRRKNCHAIVANVPGAGCSRAAARNSCRRLVSILYRLDTGVEAGDLQICHDSTGAPRLKHDGKPSNHSISVSHSGDWIAVALSGHVDVGIDVERIDRRRPTEKYQALLGWRGAPTDAVGFYTKWTLWEACFKAVRGESLAECHEAFESLDDAASSGLRSREGKWTSLVGHLADVVSYTLVTRDKSCLPFRKIDRHPWHGEAVK